MSESKYIKKVKKIVVTLKRRNPFSLAKENDGIKLKIEDKSFDPNRQEHTNRTYLVTVEGQDTRVKEVKKHGDDMVLEYDDKQCAITSKPLIIEGNHFYFTKDGWLGTMALNEDTMLDGDVYQPTKESYTNLVKKDDVDWTNYPDIEEKDMNTIEKDGVSYYKIDRERKGDIALLHGSKKTLKTMNEAKRLRKLLQPSSMSKTKMIMFIGSGVALGYMIYPQIQ